MKEYTISVDKRVLKSFRKLPLKHARQIREALERLKVNPHPQDSIKLKTSDGYRVTVGEYCILYTVREDTAALQARQIFLLAPGGQPVGTSTA